MSKSKPGLRVIMKRVKGGRERSALFHYLVKHHDRFVEEAPRGKVPWTILVEDLSAEIGEPVTEAVARNTWLRVKRSVQTDRARKTTATFAQARPPQAAMPSRVSPGWAPIPLPPAHPPVPSASTVPDAGPEISANAAETLARLRRHVNERSGRKPT